MDGPAPKAGFPRKHVNLRYVEEHDGCRRIATQKSHEKKAIESVHMTLQIPIQTMIARLEGETVEVRPQKGHLCRRGRHAIAIWRVEDESSV